MCIVLNSLKSSPGPGLARTEIVLRFGLRASPDLNLDPNLSRDVGSV
jgi:hypothetical protein